MAGDEALRKLLVGQRRRLIASVLGHAERELYPDLSSEQAKAFRAKVLAAVDSYHDLMLDILGATDPDEMVNAAAMVLLAEVRVELEAARGAREAP